MTEPETILENCNFQFTQEANCLTDQDEFETIDIEFNSSLGIDRDGDGFFVIKTEKWSIMSGADLDRLFDRIRKVLTPNQSI